ncbi:hypothetical protein R1flu_007792 [Riccia fluitans]|uniref:Rab3 GTPase-activating protein catalytic subunit n=1 Tax=Riccia fluitans TaxID=41844 RepID=A0ABD1Z029_9MARC
METMERIEKMERVPSASGDRFLGSPSASSTSGAVSDGEPEDLQGFDDYTIASSWERFIASVETICREWQAAGPEGLLEKGAISVDGSRNLHRIHQEVSFGKKLYVIVLFFQLGAGDEIEDEWPAGLHHLQLWFGVTDFLVAAPVTLSGVILDAPEATTLLSTVAVALSSCGSHWPAFVPVHDRTRKAYKGVQGTSSSYSITYEADRIGSWVPVRFMHLEGLYELFVSKVAFTAPNTAAVPSLRVEFTMRLTYRAPMIGYDYQSKGGPSSVAEPKPDYDGESPNEPMWDEDLPWASWHSVDDPVKGFELIATWKKMFVNDSHEMSEYENISTFHADEWALVPTFSVDKEPDQPEEGFGVRLEGLANAFSISANAQFVEDFANVVKPEMDLLLETFTVPPPSVLERVLKDLFYAAVIPTGEGFTYEPRGHSIKGAPRDSLFGRFAMHSLFFGTCNIRAISDLWLEFVREIRFCWDECQPLPRVSPEDSPDLRTCLLHQKLQMLAVCIKLKSEERSEKAKHAPLHDSPRVGKASKEATEASRADQSDFQQKHGEVRTSNSDVRHPLDTGTKVHDLYLDGADGPYTDLKSPQDEMESLFHPGSESPNPASKKKGSGPAVENAIVENGYRSAHEEGSSSEDDEKWQSWSEEDEGEADVKEERRGSAGPLENMMLLHSYEPLHAPITQMLPLMTEDMLMEREQAIASLSRSQSEKQARLRLQTDILASDMAAFKAANPRAALEDFVRWHSPRDWLEYDDENGDAEISGSVHTDDSGEIWPPRGRLSQRMSQPGNLWAQIWDQIGPQPACEQKPLFDFQREGEKVMHYLDTVRPQQLLGQMLCTAFVNCLEILKRTRIGDLPRLRSGISGLYSSANIVLEPISTMTKADVPSKEYVEIWNKALHNLCNLFRDVEKDVFVAASLYQKLKLAPLSLVGLFNSYLDDGKSLARVAVGGSSNGGDEREQIAELFPPAETGVDLGTRSRMGNYLNGHEPDVREVKLKCYEEDLRRTLGSRNERRVGGKGMACHRMYISGTANDLQVALTVVSRD